MYPVVAVLWLLVLLGSPSTASSERGRTQHLRLQPDSGADPQGRNAAELPAATPVQMAARPGDTALAAESSMRQVPTTTLDIAATTIDFTNNNTPLPELKELQHNMTTTLKMTAEDILEGDSDTFERRVEQVAEDVSRLPEALARFEHQMTETLEALLPGVKNRKSTRVTLPVVVTLSVVWLAFYFTQIYDPDDARDQYDSWNNSEKFKELEDKEKQKITDQLSELPEPETTLERESVEYMKANPPNNALRHADLVFVFHNPEYPYADSEEEIDSKQLMKMLLRHKEAKHDMAETGMKPFAEIHDLLNQGLDQLKGDDDDDDIDDLPTIEEEKKGITGGLKATAQSFGKSSKKAMATLGEKAKQALKKQKIDVSKKEARIAVIQDMWTWAENNGFSVDIFASIDSDELFLCVSMRRSMIVRFYLQEARTELQIQPHVVKNLNIGQDPEDPCSSPPFVVYDKRIVKSLYESNVPDAEPQHEQRVISRRDDKALFRAFFDRDSRGSVMSSKDRIFAILQVLNKDVDLESAKAVGVLLDWYPAHSELFLEKLKETWTPYPGYLAEQLWVQPISLIKDYFGTQIAFSFAWQGLHLKGLLGLTAIAMMVEFFKYGPPLLVEEQMMQERQMLPFSIVIMIWARIMLNLWENEQEFLTELWNMEHGTHIERPAFKGVLATSEVNAHEEEEVIPKSERIFLRVSSTLVTVACCVFVFSCIGLWVFMQRGRMDLVSSVALSMFIKIAEFSYNALSAKLAEYENHKYEDAFHDCWAWQQFMFQAVNTYWACAAIALAQIMHGQCGQGEDGQETCWGSLKNQLTMLMLILMGCSVAFLGLEWILVKINFWSEDKGLVAGLPPDQAQRVFIERSYLEEQSKSNHFGTREQIENKLQLVLGLGFVLLFGTLQPLVVPLCLIHFTITVETRAHLLVHYTKRCVPHRLAGIGAWRDVVILLMNVSVFSNGFLLITWGRFLKGGSLIAKLTGLILWIVLVSVLWAIVDMVVPRKSAEAELVEKRRSYVKRILTETCMDEQDGRRRETPKAHNADDASGQARSCSFSESSSFAATSMMPKTGALRGDTSLGSSPEHASNVQQVLEYSNTQTFLDPHTRRAIHVHMQPEDMREKEVLQSQFKRMVQDNDWDQIPTLSGRRVFPKKEYIRRSDTLGTAAGVRRQGRALSGLFTSSSTAQGSPRT